MRNGECWERKLLKTAFSCNLHILEFVFNPTTVKSFTSGMAFLQYAYD